MMMMMMMMMIQLLFIKFTLCGLQTKANLVKWPLERKRFCITDL